MPSSEDAVLEVLHPRDHGRRGFVFRAVGLFARPTGVDVQSAQRDELIIDRTITYSDPNRGVDIHVLPSDCFRITFMTDYKFPALGTQYTAMYSLEHDFIDRISSARTFCFLSEIRELKKQGLIKGGSVDNALVFIDRKVEKDEIQDLKKLFGIKSDVFMGENGILNGVKLRYSNEPVRHKVLDLIGDLALLGMPIRGHVIAARSGHAANVELIALDNAEIKYSTVQNWYPGDKDGKGGIYNFVTKRGLCKGKNSKISWTQVETGSAITWKYPSCILQGDNSVGEFYSVAITNNFQQADTGTKMIHLGRNTSSRIIAKGISAGKSQSTYRGLVKMMPKAEKARNYTQCDSLLIGKDCGAHTIPYIESKNPSSKVEHEATTSKIADDQLFYCRQRGMSEEEAIALIVNGFCREVLQELPMEFAVEAQKLVGISLEGSVG